jgi:tetratricopeptide (TPR) repeat protein
MSSTFLNRGLIIPSAMAVCLLLAAPAFTQQKAGSSGSRGGAVGTGNIPTGTTNSTGNGTFGSINNGRTQTTPFPNTQQPPIFLSGLVMFDDGTPANTNIRIERVCGANRHLEAHTDSKGRFSFQLGQNAMVDTDASDQSVGAGPFGRSSTSADSFGGGSGSFTKDLWNCELTASYPGYRSDTVELGSRRPMDHPDVGTIVLHRLGHVEGTTISLTTALAPKNAQKDYQKGLQLIRKGKLEEAEGRLQSATEIYPKYAMAWYALGQLQQKQGRSSDARKSYQSAIAADSKFVSPYDQMALLSAQEGKWEDAANFSKQVIALDPVEYPASFWYNAIASYNLKRPADAEKSVKDLLKLDTRHKFPEAENMMAQLLLDKGNYGEAATHLRNYLTLVPNAKNADTLKQTLLKIDQASAATPAPAPKQ